MKDLQGFVELSPIKNCLWMIYLHTALIKNELYLPLLQLLLVLLLDIII